MLTEGTYRTEISIVVMIVVCNDFSIFGIWVLGLSVALPHRNMARDAKTKTRDLWFDSDRVYFMEVEFKRPMVVPLSLRVETADVASKTSFERDRQGPLGSI
jgi:hypothetical protein